MEQHKNTLSYVSHHLPQTLKYPKGYGSTITLSTPPRTETKPRQMLTPQGASLEGSSSLPTGKQQQQQQRDTSC